MATVKTSTSLTSVALEVASSMGNHNQSSNTSGGAGDGSGDEHSKLTIGILASLYTLIFIIGITGKLYNKLLDFILLQKKKRKKEEVRNLVLGLRSFLG